MYEKFFLALPYLLFSPTIMQNMLNDESMRYILSYCLLKLFCGWVGGMQSISCATVPLSYFVEDWVGGV